MKVRYEGVEYEVYMEFSYHNTFGTQICRQDFCNAVAKATGVPVDQQILSFGNIPFENISGALSKGSTFILRSCNLRNPDYNKTNLLELQVKDEYENENYYYVPYGTKFSVLKIRLNNSGFARTNRLVAQGCLQWNGDMTINENITFYMVPEKSWALFITTTDPFMKDHLKTYCLSFDSNTKVSDLKRQICIKTGFQTRVQSLKFGDIKLEDDKTVNSYVLQDGSTLKFEFHFEAMGNKLPNNQLHKALKHGAINATILGACGIIFNLLSRVHIPREMAPSIKICIAASIVVGVISGIGKYKYDGPSYGSL